VALGADPPCCHLRHSGLGAAMGIEKPAAYLGGATGAALGDRWWRFCDRQHGAARQEVGHLFQATAEAPIGDGLHLPAAFGSKDAGSAAVQIRPLTSLELTSSARIDFA